MKSLLLRWDAKEEASIWRKAIFVFDSSALLNFYEFSDSTRQDIYQNIFPFLKDRLWITNQTEYEFLKHRDKVINRPEQLYREIKDQHYPTKHLKAFIQQYEQLKSRTGKDSRHPYFLPKTFDDFDSALSTLSKSQQVLEKNLDQQIEQRLADHAKEIKNDLLLSFFQVTHSYTYQQLMELAKEGEFRYRHKIPPGYADEKAKEEFGISKFGDLVIWKQAIELARLHKKPILLVIDDLKADWCITDKADKAKLLAPRDELIKEMLDEGGVPFWSYSTSQFVFKAKEILKSKISAGVLKEVKEVAKKQSNLVEKAVFAWAKKRFKADETYWAYDFWKKDTGADIIQTVDGVVFSIQIRNIPVRIKMKELQMYIEDIKSIQEEDFTFESNMVVLVGETAAVAISLHNFMAKHLPGFEVFTGYINEQGNFEESIQL